MPVTRSWAICASVGAALAVVAACSDSSSSTSFAASGGAFPPESIPPGVATSSPGSGMGFESPCPGEAPVNASVCDSGDTPRSRDFTCEYGHDLDRDCNDVYRCSSRWSREPRGACFGRCPETFDAIVPGAPCSDPAVGCSYLEGTCACVIEQADGGALAADGGEPPAGSWRCAPPPKSGCPAQRPPIGSDCVRPMVCDYGSCIIERDATFACVDRRWIQTDTRCTDGGGR